MPALRGKIAISDSLPAELEHRVSKLESGEECGEDFDGLSACWLVVLGIVIPAGLLLLGWLA